MDFVDQLQVCILQENIQQDNANNEFQMVPNLTSLCFQTLNNDQKGKLFKTEENLIAAVDNWLDNVRFERKIGVVFFEIKGMELSEGAEMRHKSKKLTSDCQLIPL